MRHSDVYHLGRTVAWRVVLFFVLLTGMSVVSGCGSGISGPICIAGKSHDGSACSTPLAPVHEIPFRKGYSTKIAQGFHGYLSHRDGLAYSVDLECEIGTPIVASRSGRVWAARKDSDHGCPDASCANDANFVILDHGDGTFSEYYHLMYQGVFVDEGEMVCPGQLIGACGNTGFSTGPHLHFAVTDPTRRSMPFQFREARAQGFGFPLPDTRYTSLNQLRTRCRQNQWSRLPKDAFAHHGVVLRQELPMVWEAQDAQFWVEGVYFGDQPHISIHRQRTSGQDEWIEECWTMDDRGRFRFPLTWPADKHEPGMHWLMITGADEKCRTPGWAWSYRVLYQPREAVDQHMGGTGATR